MNPKIKNRNTLLQTGDIESRRIVLDVAEATLKRLDSYHRIHSILSIDSHILTIGKKQWDLSQKKNIYLIGAGKACNAMALAVEKSMGDWLTEGIAIVKLIEPADKNFIKTRVYVGGHPLPNAEGVRASKEVLSLIDKAKEDLSLRDERWILCIDELPIEGITLQDEIDTMITSNPVPGLLRSTP